MQTPAQRFGRRLVILWICYAAAAAAFVSFTASADVSPDLAYGGPLVAGLGALCLLALTSRIWQRSAIDGPYVFFLRPFWKDALAAEAGQVSDEALLPLGGGLMFLVLEFFGSRSLELAFARRTRPRLGVLVAIGNPRDRLPRRGAHRVYCDDDEWQAVCRTLIVGARCVLMQLGDTPGLQWELEQLRMGPQRDRLFIVTEPYTSESPSPIDRRSAALWRRAHQTLTAAGWSLPAEDPGRGAVVCFTPSGEGQLLVRCSHDVGVLAGRIARHLSGRTSRNPAGSAWVMASHEDEREQPPLDEADDLFRWRMLAGTRPTRSGVFGLLLRLVSLTAGVLSAAAIGLLAVVLLDAYTVGPRAFDAPMFELVWSLAVLIAWLGLAVPIGVAVFRRCAPRFHRWHRRYEPPGTGERLHAFVAKATRIGLALGVFIAILMML